MNRSFSHDSKEAYDSDGPKRKSSDCYSFSDNHLKTHQSNLETNRYAIASFGEYLEVTKTSKSRSTERSASGAPRRKLSKPEILEARKKKFAGHSRSQSNPAELHVIEVQDASSSKRDVEQIIQTFPVNIEAKDNESDKWKRLKFRRFS